MYHWFKGGFLERFGSASDDFSDSVPALGHAVSIGSRFSTSEWWSLVASYGCVESE